MSGRAKPPLLEQPVIAHEHQTCRRPGPRRPGPGRARKPSPAVHDAPLLSACSTMARAIGCSERASRAAARLEDLRGHDAVEGDDVGHLRPAVGQRAGLVEGDGPDLGRPLQVHASLDQHAPPRRAGQRGHDGHRRGDDERARARDDQEHERPVEPGTERLPERQRGHDGNGDGRGEHRRRVVRWRTARRTPATALAAPAPPRRG